MSEEQPGRYRRSVNGMVASMIVLVGLVLAFVGLRALLGGGEHPPLPEVAYGPAAHRAAHDGRLAVFSPPTLPRGWKATSVSYTRVPAPRWHLGVLTGAQEYVGLEESTSPLREMVRQHVDKRATAAGTVELTGPGGSRTWRVWQDTGGDHAVSLRLHGTTLLVVGSAGLPALERYTSSLDPIT